MERGARRERGERENEEYRPMKPISGHEKARVSEDTDCVVEKLREIRRKKNQEARREIKSRGQDSVGRDEASGDLG